MDNTLSIVRFINFILVIFAILAWFIFNRSFKKSASLAPLTWLFNLFFFYSYFFYGQITNLKTDTYYNILGLWAALINTHGIILLILVAHIVYTQLLQISINKKDAEAVKKTEIKYD